MSQIKLIYFDGCPNAEHARSVLTELSVPFVEIEQNTLSEGDPLRCYSSPAILEGERLVFGTLAGSGGGCSLEIPDPGLLKSRLESFGTSGSSRGKKVGFFSALGSFGSSAIVGFCPICIPAFGAFLSAVGLGFLVNEDVLRFLVIILLAVTMTGLLWSYLKEHRNIWPVIGGVLTGLSLYVGRYVYFGSLVNTVLMYGGIAGIIAVSFWNLRLRKIYRCGACIPTKS